MRLLTKAGLLALAVALAACEHTAPNVQPDPVDPAPPRVNAQAAGTSPSPTSSAPRQQQVQQPQSQQQSSVVITVHLAQEKDEPSLVAIDAGGAPLYALPQPVLTQADMGRVSPVTAQDQSTYLLLEMNQNGIPKLRTITEKARGHYLLLSVQGQLVSVAKISETISDGRLLVSTQNPEHTQAILRMMRGG